MINLQFKASFIVLYFSTQGNRKIPWPFHRNRRAALAKRKHTANPVIVGIRKANIVHLMLPVSFLIVISVVEHGQCIREKSAVLPAVIQFHPFAASRV